jgi:hypothetical protein
VAKDTVVNEARKQGQSSSQPSGRPNVIEPARATPMEGVTPRDPRLGTP